MWSSSKKGKGRDRDEREALGDPRNLALTVPGDKKEKKREKKNK